MPARTWRDADLRGGHGSPPTSITSVVRHAHLALAVARWGESFLFLAAGLCITLAAAALSGVALDRPGAWVVAALGGLCAGAAWGIEHFQRPAAVARELDRRLRQQGGLLTAFELERDRVVTPMGLLVVQRVCARLRTREAVRVMFPPLALPVAAPLLGAALLALALSRSQPELPAALDLGQLTRGMLAAVGSADEDGLNADGTLESGVGREVLDAVREIRRLEQLAGSLQERPAEARAELERLDRRLAELGPRLARDPELAARVDAARNWLDAARMGLEDAASPGQTPGTGADLAAGSGDGTMAGSAGGGAGGTDPSEPDVPAGGEAAADGRPALPPAVEAGTTAESWWPREYDGIVAGWIELRRLDPKPLSR